MTSVSQAFQALLQSVFSMIFQYVSISMIIIFYNYISIDRSHV